MTNNNMYENTKTWNPFKGCKYDCVYCKPSFQRQSKRWGKGNCQDCYDFTPHFHEERLKRIPSAKTIFVAGSGDISFCYTDNVIKIIDRIKEHNKRCPDKTYYFQSKNPATFERFMDKLPDNCVLLTTIETDQTGYSDMTEYGDYSDAPRPHTRLRGFKDIDYLRKVVTIEPIMEFSPVHFHAFSDKIISVNPEYVWIGFNTRPEQVKLPEPSKDEVRELIRQLKEDGIEVRGKELRGIEH